MKRKFILFTAAAAMAGLVLSSYSSGPSTMGLGNRTGSNGNNAGCAGGCHGGSTASLVVTTIVGLPSAPLTPVASYTPGTTYTVTVNGTNPAGGHPAFGFQSTAVRAASPGSGAGTLATGGTANIAVRTPAGSPPLIEHTSALAATTTNPQNEYRVQYSWTAPAAGTGPVRFYTILNSVNGNGTADAGDVSNSQMIELPEAPTSVANLSGEMLISTYPNPASGMLNVKLEQLPAGEARLILLDGSGKAVRNTTATIQAGNATAGIDVSGLGAGVYFLDIAVGGAHRAVRVAVQ